MQCEGLRALADFRARGGHSRSCPAITTSGSARSTSEHWEPPCWRAVRHHGPRPPPPRRSRPPAGGPQAMEGLDGSASSTAFGKCSRPWPVCSTSFWNGRTRAAWPRTSAVISPSSATMRPDAGARPTSWSSATSTAPWTTSASTPRMIVLGGWQERSSYLTINSTGATFHVVADERGGQLPGRSRESSFRNRTARPHEI